MRDVETRPRRNEWFIIAAIILVSLPLILGFFLLILSSFSEDMITNLSPSSFRPTIENWINVFQGKLAITGGIRQNILKITFNTLIVALGVSGIVTLISTLAEIPREKIDDAPSPHASCLSRGCVNCRGLPFLSLNISSRSFHGSVIFIFLRSSCKSGS